MNRLLALLSLVSLLVACSTAQPAPAPTPLVETAPEGPADASAIASLLGARHVEDLPSEETLRAHEDPAATLRWIASHHRRMVIRARALQSLRFFDDEATRDYLLEVLASDAHPMLHAAAATGTARLTLDGPLRSALLGVRDGGDPRVERAVDTRLGPRQLPAEPTGAVAP